ncbi:MAG: high-potential iron-sulfur protein, partial [Proteobacteria bacterium]|nr:high-potential iron-sulfur protein [Pseudomonadota bacterium]
LVAATSATPNPSAGASGLKWVPETDPTAKALKYVSDATKANRTDRSGVKGKDQNCAGCSLYTKQGTIDGKEAGKCLMIQGGSVTAIGWCGSWAKKA